MIHRILIVDDNQSGLELLVSIMEIGGYDYDVASNGLEAEKLIFSQAADYYSTVLTDWNMPEKTGLELLKALKDSPERSHIPVILQTARTQDESLKQALKAGAFYFLQKPLNLDVILAVLKTATETFSEHQNLANSLNSLNQSLNKVNHLTLNYRSIDDCRALAGFLASFTTYEKPVSIAVFELLINAVEHGNLGITYAEKTQLMRESKLKDEIYRRLELPDYQDKIVKVQLSVDAEQVKITIKDMGQGFNFADYLEISMERMLDLHGRGVMMANNTEELQMVYSEEGTCVTVISPKKAS